MFGYIKTHRPELKVREDELYKGIYCSLCRELGRGYGVLSRMFLSYDAAFLALALMSTTESSVDFEQKRCPFNPTKKCNFCKNQHEEITYSADISVLLLYYKLRDNVRDSTLFKALIYKILLILITGAYKKAKKRRPEWEKLISDYSQSQEQVEKSETSSIDMACEPTALMLSELFTFGCQNDEQRAVRQRVGYCLGRWIYLIDAFDDIDKDRKSGNYNPFIISGNLNNEKIKGDLLMTAGEITKAYELLDIKKFKSIVENVVYDGLYFETLKVYERRLRNE